MACITSERTGEQREVPDRVDPNGPDFQLAAAPDVEGGVALLEAPDYDKQDGVPYRLCMAYFEPDRTRARYNNANGVCEIARTWPKRGCGASV